VNDILLVEFSGGEALRGAARKAKTAGYRLIDAFTPFPVEGLVEELDVKPSFLRVAMFIGGAGAAAVAYGLEWYSAVIDYPINSGGRPLHSWPAFMMFPFAIGILSAAIAGLITLLVQSGLPRLNYPLFAVDGFERASQDAFLLALASPAAEADLQRAHKWLCDEGAVAIWEVRA
jgi:hypothetical protein